MAQDYAKQRNSDAQRRRPVRAATKSNAVQPGTHWSWFFSGLMAGVILAIAGYLGVVKLEADAAESAQTVQGTEDPAELPAFLFDFYRNLANAEVAVNAPPATDTSLSAEPQNLAVPAPDTPAPALAVAETGNNYLLQAGSFQNRQDADNQRARIILLNLNANVVPGVVSGRTFHRVQVGPFAARRDTEQARDILSENNIDSILLQIR